MRFQARQAPDGPLDHLERALRQRGFSTEPGKRYDLAAKRGLDRAFVGIAPAPSGLAARIKVKSLFPGRTTRLVAEITDVLAERLGAPTGQDTMDDGGGA